MTNQWWLFCEILLLLLMFIHSSRNHFEWQRNITNSAITSPHILWRFTKSSKVDRMGYSGERLVMLHVCFAAFHLWCWRGSAPVHTRICVKISGKLVRFDSFHSELLRNFPNFFHRRMFQVFSSRNQSIQKITNYV